MHCELPSGVLVFLKFGHFSCELEVQGPQKDKFEYVRFQLNVQNVVSPQPCVRKLGISLVLLNFLGCNCGW